MLQDAMLLGVIVVAGAMAAGLAYFWVWAERLHQKRYEEKLAKQSREFYAATKEREKRAQSSPSTKPANSSQDRPSSSAGSPTEVDDEDDYTIPLVLGSMLMADMEPHPQQIPGPTPESVVDWDVPFSQPPQTHHETPQAETTSQADFDAISSPDPTPDYGAADTGGYDGGYDSGGGDSGGCDAGDCGGSCGD